MKILLMITLLGTIVVMARFARPAALKVRKVRAR